MLNGLYVVKKSFRYFVEEIYDAVFRDKFPNSRMKVGDEVIKINQFYCEHLGNVEKYIEKTAIRSLQMISTLTGEVYFDEDLTVDTLNVEDETTSTLLPNFTATPSPQKRKKRLNRGLLDVTLTENESTISSSVSDMNDENSSISFGRRHGCLALNGLYIVKNRLDIS